MMIAASFILLLLKTLFLFILIYSSALLQNNTVYDLFSLEKFKATNFTLILLLLLFFI